MVVSYDSCQEDLEVIRMSQWAEVRHMHLVDGVLCVSNSQFSR